jgi:hypothetical protein
VYTHSLADEPPIGQSPLGFTSTAALPFWGPREPATLGMGRTLHTMAQAFRHGAVAAAVVGALSAGCGLCAALSGCGLVIGLGDRELFPSDAGAPEGGEGASDASEGGAAASECPFAGCAGGVCCYPADNVATLRTACQGGCAFGQFAVGCAGPEECGGATCCATLQASLGRRVPTPAPPACAGWFFRGSTCGACTPQVPTSCGTDFTAAMCEKSADCPSSSPNCCRIGSGDLFAYCMDSATRASVDPFQCLP